MIKEIGGSLEMAKVSLANIEDAEQIAKISMQVSMIHFDNMQNEFKQPRLDKTIAYIEDCIKNKDRFVIKAEDKNMLCGYMIVSFRYYPEEFFVNTKIGFISDLGVDENFRGCGIGKQIFAFAENLMKENGVNILDVDLYSFNHSAERLYDNLGFETIKHYKRKFL